MAQVGQRAVRDAVVWEALRGVLDGRSRETGRDRLDIVDAGGGTGGFAVPLARLGHAVTVVDPSPDSLAALERRAAEAGVSVHAIQGDAGDLAELVPAEGADLVLCHNVLEYVEDPAAALGAVRGLLREGAAVSVLVPNQVAAVINRAVTGRFDEALRVLSDPAGRWGERDPLPRRFTADTLLAIITEAGLRPAEVHGVRVFADLLPSGLVDGEPRATDSLVALERSAATHPALRQIAAQLHVLATP
ncbi:class I SAM-dependent methyltransferase [Bailinhaonella thermotolerans]|uniref:class I SAM-dependent methyltransferase n=1 Tax=Bailinhaonella thermotolerans TaxID=1070861 RepID=UPI00192A5356|nr:methyltransferase [Bailinhaonella thermotolerans]